MKHDRDMLCHGSDLVIHCLPYSFIYIDDHQWSAYMLQTAARVKPNPQRDSSHFSVHKMT